MSDEKKIIVDDDWKEQVRAEKEQAQKQQARSDATDKADEVPFPPASFPMLLSTLATEAMVALGQLPHPLTDKPQLNRQHAKFLIDTIDVLRDKTQGNLTADEQQMIEDLLHQLRMAFVAITTAVPAETDRGAAATDEGTPASKIELP